MASGKRKPRETIRYTVIIGDAGPRTEQVLTSCGDTVDGGDPAVMAEVSRLLLWHMHGLPCPPARSGPPEALAAPAQERAAA